MAHNLRSTSGPKKAQNAEEVGRAVRNHFKVTNKDIAKELAIGERSLRRYLAGERDWPSDARHAFIGQYRLDPELPYDAQKHLLKSPSDQASNVFSAAFDLRSSGVVNIAMPKNDEPHIRIEQANAFRCRACGVIEDLWRPYCRCGAYLHSQVRTTAWEAVPEVADELNAAIKKATLQSLGLTVVGLIPLTALAVAMHGEVIALKSEQLANLWAVGLACLVLCLVFAGQISRKEKALRKRRNRMGFEDILSSATFRRAAREKTNPFGEVN